MEPRVTVVIPAYNAAQTLDRALESVAIQGEWIKETLVIDDGSTDETAQIAGRRRWVTVIRKTHEGAAAARNAGLSAASGSVIAFLDADDGWLPGKLDAQMKIFENHPEVSFVSSDFYVCSVDGKCVRGYEKHSGVYDIPALIEGHTRLLQSQVFEGLCRALFTATPTVTFRRSLAQHIGYFDSAFKVAEDFDFYLRFARAAKFAVIDAPLARVHYQTDSLGSEPFLVLKETFRMLDTFEARNGELSFSEKMALKRKSAQVLLSLGYQCKEIGDLTRALGFYLKAFTTVPSWQPLRYAIRAIGSAIIP